MCKRIKFLYSIGLTVCIPAVLLFLLPLKGSTCPIPVFRYALEYWDTDPYSLEILIDGSLSHEAKETVNFLKSAASGGEFMANLEIKLTDAGMGIDGVTRAFLKERNIQLPVMILRYPRISGNNRIIWWGMPNQTNAELLIQSPARKAMGQMLAGQATAVWLLLESGDRRKDRAALEILEKELRRLERTLVLPEEQLWLGAKVEMPAVHFETIRISRNDHREAHLVNMLLNLEDDLADFRDDPIVFPVYGRGIALYGIVGKGINEWNIRDAAEFLTGPCSCQAKLLNPGTDLLMSLDWDSRVEKITDISIANPLSGMGDFSRKEEEVKRLLESATARRFGTDADRTGAGSSPQGRVIYLDLPGSVIDKAETGRDMTEVKPSSAVKENPVELHEAEPVITVQEHLQTIDGGAENHISVEQSEVKNGIREMTEHKNQKGFSRMFLIFGGFVLLIFLAGTLLYLLTAKK